MFQVTLLRATYLKDKPNQQESVDLRYNKEQGDIFILPL